MLNEALNVRRIHPMTALMASLVLALSLGPASAKAAPPDLDGHGSAIAPPAQALVRIANQLPGDVEVQQLGNLRLGRGLEIEAGEMAELWVDNGRARVTIEAPDRKLRGGLVLKPGGEYCMVLHSRRAPTFRFIGGKLLGFRSYARTFEAPKIKCMQIAARNGR
jgi:hypothetical protein